MHKLILSKFNLKLTKRERYYVYGGLALVTLFLVFQLIVSPLLGGKDRIKRSIQAKEKALKEIVLLSSEYKALKQDSTNISELLTLRPKDFTLFSFLEKQAGQSGVKPNIKYMKPSTSSDKGPYMESSVEMKLDNITLRQLVEYLHLIESPDNVVMVKRISVKQGKGSPEYLTVLLQLVTFQEK